MDLQRLLTDPAGYAMAVEADLARIAREGRGGVAGIAEVRRVMAVFEDNFQVPEGRKVPYACRKGCAWCCNLRVSATAAEILLLAEALRRLPEPDRSETMARVTAARIAVAGMDHDTRRAAGVPCPMLDAEGACGVYAGRPLSCRGLVSFDADACRTIMGGQRAVDEVPLSRPHLTAKSILMVSLMGALKARKLAWWQYELIQGLDIALGREDALADWLAGGDPLAAAKEPLDTLYAQI